jgi:hypothetical protein
MARSHNYPDRRPPISDGMSEFQPIHRAGHVNVGKYNPDIPAALKYPYCFVGIGSFNDLEAGILDRSDGAQANQRFIFNDEDDWRFAHFSPSTPTHAVIFHRTPLGQPFIICGNISVR